MANRRINWILRTTLLLIVSCVGHIRAEDALQLFQYTEVCMGVETTITLYANSEERAKTSARSAFDEIVALENIISDYQPASELNALAQKAGGSFVKVSPLMLEALDTAKTVADFTQGAFDPTLGRLTLLWRQTKKSGTLPDTLHLTAARNASGYRKLVLNKQDSSVRIVDSGLRLDLGGSGKGLALDRAIATLKEAGIEAAMIEMGGDLIVSGAPPGTKGWMIEVPNAPHNNRLQTLTNRAVSTSGDLYQYVIVDGKRYSHIVDPKTGLGLTQSISATVIGEKGAWTDPLATALCVNPTLETKVAQRGMKVFIRKGTINEIPDLAH